jgi:peptidoglycan/xylan/chitin deacetylase (PgdA/CDA1 family)
VRWPFWHGSPSRLATIVVLGIVVVLASSAQWHSGRITPRDTREAPPAAQTGDLPAVADAGQLPPDTSLALTTGDGAGTPAALTTPVTAQPEPPVQLSSSMPAVATTPEDFLLYRPNELGVVPILEYHVITTNPDEEAQFVRTADDMRADLQWLYDNNFHTVPLRDVVNNTIAIPAGKHPVALTFDDGSSTQFSFVENEHGELVPHPDCAVGILEAFFAAHPDFGRGGHFGLLINNQFAWPDESQMPYFEQKVAWLVEHGYEIGNHTMHHTNLTDIPNREFKSTIAEPMLWANEVVGDRPENASTILTLPYGTLPDPELHPDQDKAIRRGFNYQGHRIHLSAALLVGADPTVSPASTQWDPYRIPRIQAFDESIDYWFGQFASGGQVLYTSDGDPHTIAVPNPLPPSLQGHLDEEALVAAGKQVLQYDAVSGQFTTVSWIAPPDPVPGPRRADVAVT